MVCFEREQDISADGLCLFFSGDGFVDSLDMCIMVDHWGMDEPLCDIGPTPFGDGIVDVQDMIVIAEHLFEETPPAE